MLSQQDFHLAALKAKINYFIIFAPFRDVSSVGLERLLDRQEVTGSNPVRPTSKNHKIGLACLPAGGSANRQITCNGSLVRTYCYGRKSSTSRKDER